MKIVAKITVTTIVLLLMLMADMPLLPVEDAQAIFGVRRRTAVVAYSIGKSSANAAAASQQQTAVAQQQAATAQQQAAVAQQQASAAQAASGVPIGSMVNTLPAGCVAVTVGNTQYQDCSGSFYKAAFQGDKLVYVVVPKPL